MRSTARAILALAIVLLAVVAAPRVALDFRPRNATSEIFASLQFPPSSGGDPVDMTTRYVLPLETAVRSLGDVIATRGDVGADGASLTIRFRRGIDAELKAARLSSELASLRAKLPEGSSVEVWPSSDNGAQASAVIALTDRDAAVIAERVADELRATPGVREVRTFGAIQQEIDVRTFGDAPQGLADTIRAALVPHPLGRRVLSGASATRVRDARVNGQRLESIASVVERRADPQRVAHVNGRDAVVLSIVRDADVSLFAFDRAIHATLRGHGTRDLENDAADLRALLLRVLLGALLASALLALTGRPLLAAYIPLAFAVMINICAIASLRIDALSLLAICAAVAGIAPMAIGAPASCRLAGRHPAAPRSAAGSRRASRLEGGAPVAALFVLLPLIATSLASDSLTAILATPARMFAIAGIAALIAATILPAGRATASTRFGGGRLERKLLRASAAIVLAAVAMTTFLLAWFGERLDPRHSGRTAERSHLYLRLALPAGTPLAPTVRALTNVERELAKVDGVPRSWSFAEAGRGTIVADVAPAFQRPDLFELLRLRVEAAMPLAGGVVRVEQSFDRGAARDNGSLEERPYADELGQHYRVLLKGTDASAMRRALESLTTRLAQLNIRRGAITPEWPEATTQVTLTPRPGVPPATAALLAQTLAERTSPPRPRVLPDGRRLVAAGADAPHKEDEVPAEADLFSLPLHPMTVEAAFDVHHEPVSGRVTRELGRFVLPIEIFPGGTGIEQQKDARKNADRTLSLMHFPAGIVLERPSLATWELSRDKLRLFALAALLPSLLFALAAIVLSSLRRALIALAPGLVGVACIAPALLAASATLDEVVLLASGGALCCVTALATTVMRRSTGVAATYRTLRSILVPCALASFAGATMLFMATTGGRGLGEVWRAPLLGAGVVGLLGVSALILPAAIESLFRVEERRPRLSFDAIQETSEAPVLQLQVQNLTKIYGNGFRALHRVSFELEPGVIGLLGPNGAGKTTLLRILTGLLLPTRGVVRFGGVEVRPETLADYRRRIGFLPQEFNAYAGLTAAQFLDYWALERGMTGARERAAEVGRLLAIARLEAHADRKLRDFSGGMRQRIGIARAMIGDPPLLVVDEPTTGLDIEARAHFRELITTLAKERIIILSTHIASDVEATAARLLLLASGRLVWDGAPEALIARARGRVFETIAGEADARELTRQHRITTRVRLATGVRLRGIVAEGETLPGAAVVATLEEAYLAEIAPRGRNSGASFAFVYEGTHPWYRNVSANETS